MLPIGSQSIVPRMIIQIFNGSEKGLRCDSKTVLYETKIVPFDFKIVCYDVEIVH
jgi:hypothetical protein